MSRKWTPEQKAAARLKALERWERKKSLGTGVEHSIENVDRANTPFIEPTILSPIQMRWLKYTDPLKPVQVLQYRYDRGNGNWSNWIDVPYEEEKPNR